MVRGIVATLIALAAQTSTAAGQDTPPLREPIFGKCGSYCNLGPAGPYTPERAARMGVSGYAVIECRVVASGRLKGCGVIEVQPAGMAFEHGALQMAEKKYLKVAPRVVDGAPVEEDVRVRVDYPLAR